MIVDKHLINANHLKDKAHLSINYKNGISDFDLILVLLYMSILK